MVEHFSEIEVAAECLRRYSEQYLDPTQIADSLEKKAIDKELTQFDKLVSGLKVEIVEKPP